MTLLITEELDWITVKRTLSTQAVYTGPNLNRSRGKEFLKVPNNGRNMVYCSTDFSDFLLLYFMELEDGIRVILCYSCLSPYVLVLLRHRHHIEDRQETTEHLK